MLFCNGGDCAPLVAVMEEVGASQSGFDFVRIDCATDTNKAKCAEAGFDKTPARFFTNTAEAGYREREGRREREREAGARTGN